MELAQGLTDEHKEDLDLWQILSVHVEDLQREGRDVRLGVGNSFYYRGDPVALERILINLLDNAAHYGDGKPIDVELKCRNDQVCILISDRGPGIPASQRKAVFRPFHRLQVAREERTGGSGLGLAIARQLANKNGWKIELSPRSGGGTVAILDLQVKWESRLDAAPTNLSDL